MAKDWIDEQYGPNADAYRESYKADLERELQGAVDRGDKAYAKSVEKQLAQFTKAAPKETAEKRPAAAREKR